VPNAREQLLDLLFPSSCRGCGAAAESLCDECVDRLLLSMAATARSRCDSPVGAIDRVAWGGAYEGALKSAVLALKSGDRRVAGPLWTVMRAAAGNDPRFCSPDLVCFVPSRRKKVAERGYNQAEMLASLASSDLDRPLSRALVKTRDTADQDGLTGAGRRSNVTGAFALAGRLGGESVLLVDDVLTTGSTAGECALALLNGGAAGVSLLVCARALFRGATKTGET
jgi:competence protein ComFC